MYNIFIDAQVINKFLTFKLKNIKSNKLKYRVVMKKMKKVNISGYNITNDPSYISSIFHIPYELEIQLEDLHKLALKGKKSSIKKFTRLIEKYPNVPMLKNYLSTLYQSMGNMDKANEINRRLVVEHPNYLFGKINMAAECIANNKLEKVPEILGANLDLKTLYPDRDTFHTNEVMTFFNVTIKYLVAMGDLQEAETRLEIMKEIDEDSSQVLDAEMYLTMARIELVGARMKEEEKSRIRVKQNTNPKSRKTKHPDFNHPEINIIYEKDITVISEEEIKQILSLPKESLIVDLLHVLDDGIDRYNYFKKIEKESGWDANKFSFVLQAMFLLAELKAENITSEILEILRQNEDFHSFYLSDLLNEMVWEIIYKTSENNLDELKKFMCGPYINPYAKTEISVAVMQVYYNNPKRKKEVIDWYNSILEFYVKSDIKDNIVDSEMLGLVMSEIMDAQLKELIPSAEKLFDKNYVGVGVCGDFDEFVSEIKYNISKRDYIKTQKNIYEQYKEIKLWSDDSEDEDDEIEDYDEIDDGFFDDFDINSDDDEIRYYPPSSQQPIINEVKVGRNDPCPCGSGKKYKKCCLNK